MLLAALACLTQTPPPPVRVPRAELVVYLVDAAGDLQADGWVVRVSPGQPGAPEPQNNVRRKAVDAADGTARFEGLHSGAYVVRATHTSGEQATPASVTLIGAEERSLALSVPSPPPQSCLYVWTSHPLPERDLQLEALGPDGAVHRFEALPESLNGYVARGVGPGTFTVRSIDERFEGSLKGLRPGRTEQLQLTPLPQRGPDFPELHLVFRCAETGEDLAPYRLELGLPALHVTGLRVAAEPQQSSASALPRGPFAIVGVERAGLTLAAHFHDRPAFVAPLKPLPAGDVVTRSFAVPRGAAVTGRAHDSAGRPLDDCVVLVERRVPAHHAERYVQTWPDPKRRGVTEFDHRPVREAHTVRTDRDGAFTVDGLGRGSWQVSLFTSPFHVVRSTVDVGGPESRTEVPALVTEGDATCAVHLLHPTTTGEDLVLRLQVGTGPWLSLQGHRALTRTPEGTLVSLRGLPRVPAVLLAERVELGFGGGAAPVRIELTPSADPQPPQRVSLDG